MIEPAIEYRISPTLENDDLRALFSAAWGGEQPGDFQIVLRRSVAYVTALAGPRLVGFVNIAWDGGKHAFLLDTTVHPEFQHHGIGTALVLRALEVARDHGVVWMHVDFEPHLEGFYQACGFRPTLAGLVKLA